MLYNLLKNLISAGRYDKEDMTNKLNVFFTFDQLMFVPCHSETSTPSSLWMLSNIELWV